MAVEDARQRGSALDLCSPQTPLPLRAESSSKGILNCKQPEPQRKEKAPGKKARLDQLPSAPPPTPVVSWPISVPPASAASISHAGDCAVILRFVKGSV